MSIEKEKADVQYTALPKVTANKSLMEILFQNLISNAIKFKKVDSSPRIVISAKREKNFWILAVKDNGMGINKEENKDMIFELFHRPNVSRTISGNGIGLATCKKNCGIS